MKSKYIAPVLIIFSMYLFLSALHLIPFVLNLKYFILLLMGLATVSIIGGVLKTRLTSKKISLKDKPRVVKLNDDYELYVHEIYINKQKYYFIAFKILGRETEEEQINFYKELYDAIISAYRNKSRNLHISIITRLDPMISSAFIIYKRADIKLEEFIEEAIYIQNAFQSVAPHLLLEGTNINADEFIPLPSVGDVVYGGFISQKKYEVANAEESITGEFDIQLGYNVGTEVAIGIRTKDIFRHLSIFGATGSGKSNTSVLIARELRKRGFDVIIFDWHGEYHDSLKEFNYYGEKNYIILNPLGSSEKSAGEVADMIGDVLELTDPQRYALQLAIEQHQNDPDFDIKNLPDILTEMETDFAQKQVIIALVRKLKMLFGGIGGKLISSKNGISYKELAKKMKGGNVINLSFISDIRLRKLYAVLLLKFLLEYYMSFRDKTRKVYIVLEEAQNYLRQNNLIIERALQEIRKFGVGLCIITQSPTTIDEEVLKNTNIKIVHSIKSNTDKRVVVDSMGLPGEAVNLIDKLDVGQAILTAPNLRTFAIVDILKAVD